MTRYNATIYIALILAGIAGCHQRPAARTIYLLDISQSIDPQSVRDGFAAADRLVDRMGRGDELELVPITGDARNDLDGHVLHLRAPTDRQSFDSDLMTFRRSSHHQIAALAAWAFAEPPEHTDILGTIDFALHDVDTAATGSTRLITLSDFLEDDGAIDFAKDPRLASTASAKAFADSLAKNSGGVCGCPIYLGRIKSRGRHLQRRRQDAVDAFWQEFLSTTHKPAIIHSAGADAL